MSSTFPTKLADDYVPASYLRADAPAEIHAEGAGTPEGDALQFIAFRCGRRLLAVTAVTPGE